MTSSVGFPDSRRRRLPVDALLGACGVEYQGRRARRPYNDRQDRSALQQPERRTARAVQRAFGRREISCAPAVDYRHEAQPRRPGRDVARRRVEPAAHRVSSTRLQVRRECTASQRQLDNVDKSRRRLLVLRAVAGPSSCPSSRRSRSLPRSSTAPVIEYRLPFYLNSDIFVRHQATAQ